ncbi:rRNA maturation RNase YbeY [Gimibacter soli]|uniref:Endoribonuclease YbeY n=2 Tax=Gimibacter soli TaxID=3024400 RepID=A0AAE9XV22_9PROT|nr:rRNA maturation RNase YbeY [Gimibacter soli]WCL54243.1 rRNA maturation RNase YbeY [Gimibacter soli]
MTGDGSSSRRGEPRPDGSSGSPSLLTIDIEIRDNAWQTIGGLEAMAMRAVTAALKAEADDGGVDILAVPAELSMVFTDDEDQRSLNRDYRDKDKSTNVLSFPGVEPDEIEDAAEFAAAGGPPLMLGDMTLAWGVVSREAEEQGKTLADHLTHLVVHGTLHLAGHDHIDDEEAEVMESLERDILAHLGIADPYEVELIHD